MPTTHPRISTVIERPLYETVEALAKRDHMSVSQKARDLLRRAIELDEDADLSVLAQERLRRSGKFIPHDEFWRAPKGKRA